MTEPEFIDEVLRRTAARLPDRHPHGDPRNIIRLIRASEIYTEEAKKLWEELHDGIQDNTVL